MDRFTLAGIASRACDTMEELCNHYDAACTSRALDIEELGTQLYWLRNAFRKVNSAVEDDITEELELPPEASNRVYSALLWCNVPAQGLRNILERVKV